MNPSVRAIPILAFAALVAGCDAPAPTAPADIDTVVEMGKGQGSLPSVTGSAHVFFPAGSDQRRTLTFHAVQHRDGSVTGKVRMDYAGAHPTQTFGDVKCLTIDGNTARIGIVATKSHVDGAVGGETGFVVQDNGKSGSDDLISPMWSVNFNPDFGADAVCAAQTGLVPDLPLYGGNVTVR